MTKHKFVNSLNKSDWSKYIYNHPNGNIFQSPEMYDIYNKTKNYKAYLFAIIDFEDNILGLMVSVIQKEHSGILGILSARAVVDGGPIIKNNDPNVTSQLLTEYQKFIKGKAIYSLFRNFWNWGLNGEVFLKYGFSYEQQLDILIDLKQDKSELFSKISKNKRRNVTKSSNKGTIIKDITSIEELEKSFQIIKETYQRVKVPMPSTDLFKIAFETLYPKGMIKIFGAYFENLIIGVRIELVYKENIFDWYAGSDAKHNNKYANDAILLNILQWGNENNFGIFDFGGAGKPDKPYGVRDHKLKFGGDLVEFGRYKKIHNGFLMNVAEVLYFIYKKIK